MIKLKLNDKEQSLNISKNSLDLYEVDFDNVDKESKISIDSEKGELYYEIIQEYYLTYEEFQKTQKDITVESIMTDNCNVNDTVVQNIFIANKSESEIYNGMVEISIPQGCSVKEEALSKLETLGYIEKYEYSYGKIYLYLRDFEKNAEKILEVQYKADYPEAITGGLVRCYDYYNPDTEDYSMPMVFNVN